MKNKVQAAIVIGLALPVFGILWYVADGFFMAASYLVAIVVSISISYLFYEALSCREVRGITLKMNFRRRLDWREVGRIFGAIALLPMASIIISKYTLNSSVAPIKLYVLFVLLFMVGWAMGTVETSKIIEAHKNQEIVE